MELKIETLMADGDYRTALRQMAEHYSGSVGRFCAAYAGSRAEGDDLLQETLIEAFRAMPRFRAESSVKAWLFGIARRVCIRHLRKRDRRAGLLTRWFGNPDPAEPVRDPAEQSEKKALLRKALAELTPHLREAVLLRYQAGMDHAEVAAALEIRPEAARKRVSLAVKALRSSLRPLLMEADDEDSGQEGQDGKSGEEESVSARPGPRIVRP